MGVSYKTYPKIRSIYDVKVNGNENMKNIEKKINNINELVDLKKNGRKIIIKELNKATLLKNMLRDN